MRKKYDKNTQIHINAQINWSVG